MAEEDEPGVWESIREELSAVLSDKLTMAFIAIAIFILVVLIVAAVWMWAHRRALEWRYSEEHDSDVSSPPVDATVIPDAVTK
jgi:hypothetical protein